MASRQLEQQGQPLSFDHGAQQITAIGADFKAQLAEWQAAGVVAEWRGRHGEIAGAVRLIASSCIVVLLQVAASSLRSALAGPNSLDLVGLLAFTSCSAQCMLLHRRTQAGRSNRGRSSRVAAAAAAPAFVAR